MGCSTLEKVILGPKVKTIYRYAFFSCTNLTSINVPKQAKVYDETFMECYKLHRQPYAREYSLTKRGYTSNTSNT